MAVISELCCPKCGYRSTSKTVFKCPNCKSILEVNVEISHLTRSDFDTMRQSRDHTIWRWFDFFPIEKRSSIVSLGEGCTPLIHSKRLGEHLGLSRFYLKNDTVLPTGSLKDRSNSVGLSVAKELGFMTATVMSTGNAAASVAAYSAAAGLESVVMVPAGTATSKIIQARAYGATVVVIGGDFDYDVAKLYKAAVQEFGWYDCLSSNPYRDEGKKSYAHEMVDQLDGEIPDWVIHPTAGGTGIYAMWKGFKEFLSLGWISRADCRGVRAGAERRRAYCGAGNNRRKHPGRKSRVVGLARAGGVARVERDRSRVKGRRNSPSAIFNGSSRRAICRARGGDFRCRGKKTTGCGGDRSKRTRCLQSHRPRFEAAGRGSDPGRGAAPDCPDTGCAARARQKSGYLGYGWRAVDGAGDPVDAAARGGLRLQDIAGAAYLVWWE